MSKKRKKAWLEAIDELEEKYRTDNENALDCPLCGVPEECTGCLWSIIENCVCSGYIWGNGYTGFKETWLDTYEEWKTHRLKMLKRWRRIIKKED